VGGLLGVERRGLPLLVAAVGISMFGDLLAMIPIVLHLQDTTGSGIVVAVVFVALWSPMFFLAGPAGLLVDRHEPRRVLLFAVLAQAAVACVLAFTSGTVAILALTALLGAGAAFAQPAEFALIPSVAGGDVRRANSYIETARGLGFGLGPFAGGLLAAAGGMKLGLLVDAASFLFVAAVSLVLPCYSCAGQAREAVGRARDGLVFLARDGTLRLVLGVGFVSLLFMTAVAPAEVFFAKDVLGAGDLGYGLMLGAWTMGMTIGGLVLARRIGGAATALVAIVAQSVGLLVPTLWLVLAWGCIWFLVGGVAHGLKNVLLRTLIHERVPAELHGRAFAAYNGLRNFAEIFSVMGGGVLVVELGARWTMFVAGLLPAIAGAVGLGIYARSRTPAETTPAAAAAEA
jgi:MFS family permease